MTADDLHAYVESWLQVLDEVSHYQLLGLDKTARGPEIQNAFHAFSAAFHPDRHRNEASFVRQGTSRIYKRGVEAYRVLKDPDLRADYDLSLARSLRAPGDAGGPRSLDELCHTKGGRFHARQAERAITSGELKLAIELLDKSVQAEEDNPDLQQRLEDLRNMASLSEPPQAPSSFPAPSAAPSPTPESPTPSSRPPGQPPTTSSTPFRELQSSAPPRPPVPTPRPAVPPPAPRGSRPPTASEEDSSKEEEVDQEDPSEEESDQNDPR